MSVWWLDKLSVTRMCCHVLCHDTDDAEASAKLLKDQCVMFQASHETKFAL